MAKKKSKKKKSTFISDPLDSIAAHLGKFIDKLSGEDITNLAAYGIAAYYGHKAVLKTIPPGHWEIQMEEREPGMVSVGKRVWVPGPSFEAQLSGAALGVLGLKLALAESEVASAAGVVSLAGIGLCNIFNPFDTTDFWKQISPIEAFKDAMRRLGIM